MHKYKQIFYLSHALEKLGCIYQNLQCLIAFAHLPYFELAHNFHLSAIWVVSEPMRIVVCHEQ